MLSSSLRRVGSGASEVSAVHVRHASSDFSRLVRKGNKMSSETEGNEHDYRKINQTAKHLIKSSKQGRGNSGWRHTDGRRKEPQRLKQDLLRNSNMGNSVKIQQRDLFRGHPLEHWTVEDFCESSTPALQPGTFFEIRRNTVVSYGVVIGAAEGNIGYNQDTQSLNTDGEMFLHRASDVMFAVPNFIDAFLVNRCGSGLQHTTPNELAARLRILKLARDFERAMEAEASRIGRLMNDIYPQVCAKSPDEWNKVTTMQIARMLDAAPNIPIVTLFAVHKQLMENSDEFVCHPVKHRFLHTFDVRPPSHLDKFRTVKEWVRKRSPIITAFQAKAKLLIDQSRKLAPESANEPPSHVDTGIKITFTPEEQEIIELLKLSMLNSRRIQAASFEGIIPSIIKDTRKYDEPITSYVTLKFLQEIGAYTPWEDTASKERELNLPVEDDKSAVNPVTSSTVEPLIPTSTPGLLAADPHEAVRHDFGDLPVFVIDDIGAEELDDGISIEPAVGEPGSAWLHVHVADPTAILPIDHPLMQQIQKRSESVYFEHRSWPMLPEDITRLCDMGRPDVRALGQNVVTFSAKINAAGDIADQKVRVGRVRNVHKLRYDAVNEIIGTHVSQYRFSPFVSSPPTLILHDTSKLLPHADTLKLLYEVTRRLVRNRLNEDSFSFSTNSPEVTFVDKPVPQMPTHTTRPMLYRGFPKLEYAVVNYKFVELGARSLVAECMKVAGRVCSIFCIENNIPAIRRSLPELRFSSDAQRESIIASRDELGFVSPAAIVRSGFIFPSGEFTTLPAGHSAVGAKDGEGYVRATSPLRRVEDILTHWQIKAVLSAGGGTRPPLDESALRTIAEDLSDKKRVISRAYRSHTRQWSHTYIKRFIAAQEHQRAAQGGGDLEFDPLRDMDAYIVQRPTYNIARWSMFQDVFIPKLGLPGLLPSKDEIGLDLMTPIKVNAKNVFQYDLNQSLEVTLA
ncbi:hypothetical protein M0805_008338 [Coniferiporia weirii]|nr:hypothetical protein M0805_008338 [Coniferiporia weirii]